MAGRTRPDGRLVAGAAVFGVGWGMVGFCPGPAVAALSTGLAPVLVFIVAMVAGMVLHRLAVEDRPRGMPSAAEGGAGDRPDA